MAKTRDRRWWLRLLLAGALLSLPAAAGTAAAEPSRVVVSGRLALGDGRPAANRPVLLTREVTLGDIGEDMLKYFSTIGITGFTCITGDPALEVCRQQDHVRTTDGQGRFRFVLSADDVRTSDGELRDVSVWAGLPPEPGEQRGATVSWNARPDKPNVELPEVPIWTPRLRAELDGSLATYTWRPPPAIAGATEASTSFSLRTSTQNIGVSDPSSPQRIDLRILEDAVPEASLTHTAKVEGTRVVSTSPTVRTKAGTARPLSRKQPCFVQIGDQPERTYPTCWLDDGGFSSPLADVHPENKGPRLGGGPLPVSCGTEADSFGTVRCVRAPVAAVTLDLGASRPLGDIVIRANSNQTWTYVRVEVSDDRKAWRSLGRFGRHDLDNSAVDGLILDHEWYRTEAPSGTVARYVRVRADDDPGPQDEFMFVGENAGNDPRARVKVFRGDLAAMTEIAAWPARPKPSPTASNAEGDGTATSDPATSRPSAQESSTAGSWVGPLIAAVAVLGSALALLVLLWFTRWRSR